MSGSEFSQIAQISVFLSKSIIFYVNINILFTKFVNKGDVSSRDTHHSPYTFRALRRPFFCAKIFYANGWILGLAIGGESATRPVSSENGDPQ